MSGPYNDSFVVEGINNRVFQPVAPRLYTRNSVALQILIAIQQGGDNFGPTTPKLLVSRAFDIADEFMQQVDR